MDKFHEVSYQRFSPRRQYNPGIGDMTGTLAVIEPSSASHARISRPLYRVNPDNFGSNEEQFASNPRRLAISLELHYSALKPCVKPLLANVAQTLLFVV